jgi:hypothetical protein
MDLDSVEIQMVSLGVIGSFTTPELLLLENQIVNVGFLGNPYHARTTQVGR